MEPGRNAVDVTSRLVGIDFGNDRTRIALTAQLRNALAKLRTRRGLLNQELNLLLAEMGQAGAPVNASPEEAVVLNGANPPDTTAAANGKPSAAPVAAKSDSVYSRLQEVFVKETSRPDLLELVAERTAMQSKILSFQRTTGKRIVPPPELPRLRTNWDHLLDEMRWMADDVSKERDWKRTCAAVLARQAVSVVERRAARMQAATRATAAERWVRARFVAKAVAGFWGTIRRLQTMQRNRAPVELLVRRHDPHAAGPANDLALDSNPLNEYLRAGNILVERPADVASSDAAFAASPDRIQHLIALRDALARLRFTDMIAEFEGPLQWSTLAQHQRQCVAWFEAVSTHISPSAFILADDQGLGKRVALMTWISLTETTSPHLIVTSALNLIRWHAEFRCRCPDIPVHLYSNRESWPTDLGPGTVLLAPFELVQYDSQAASRPWYSVVVDGPSDRALDFSARAWTRLSAQVRILLYRDLDAIRTDPIRTKLSLLSFVTASPWTNLSDLDAVLKLGQKPFEFAGVLGHELLNAFCLRRTLEEVRADVPTPRQIVLTLSLSDRQAALYDSVVPIDSPGAVQDLVRVITRLHLLCTHPDLIEPLFESSSVLIEIDSPGRWFRNVFRLLDQDRRQPFRAVSRRLIESLLETIMGATAIPNQADMSEPGGADLVLACCPAPYSSMLLRRPVWLPSESCQFGLVKDRNTALRSAFIPSAIARTYTNRAVRCPRSSAPLKIAQPRLLDWQSSKLLTLLDLLRKLYRGRARIAIIASSSRSLDLLQQFLRRHHFRHIREQPIPTGASIRRFAQALGSGPLIYLTSSRTMSVFAYPSLAMFQSVIAFDHDWNRICRHQMETFLSKRSRMAQYDLYRLVLRNTADQYVYDYGLRSSEESDQSYLEKLLFGPYCEPSDLIMSDHDAELVLSRFEAPVDQIALNFWRRTQSRSRTLFRDESVEPDLSYLLRPLELWALGKRPGDIIPDPIGHIRDPLRVIVSGTDPPPPPSSSSSSTAVPPSASGSAPAKTSDPFPNPLPPDTKLALVAATVAARHAARSLDIAGVLPPGVTISSASPCEPILFFRLSKSVSLEAQLRRFAMRHKLALEPEVQAPPGPLLPLQRYEPVASATDDPNDPYQWGLFATAESQAMMFRARSGLGRRKKKKSRRRGPRLAMVLVDDFTGTVRIRIAKKQLAAGVKRKAEEIAAEPPVSSKRARPEPAAPVVAAVPPPVVAPKPIAMAHPVPFTDDEDALIVCLVVLFGPNFHIVTHILECDLVVRGRLRSPKLCADRYALLTRKAKELGPRLWDRLHFQGSSGAPVPPLPNAVDQQQAHRMALNWVRFRNQVRDQAAAQKTFEVFSGAVRAVMQSHMQCKMALRTPLNGVPAEAFKEALMRSHASHAAALTAGHKRLMIPHANIGSTLSPRQIVELRSLRDRTHESKKMSAMAPAQQMTSPSVRAAKMTPSPAQPPSASTAPMPTTPLMRATAVPMSSPVVLPPADSGVTGSNSNNVVLPPPPPPAQDLDQIHSEIDQGNMFLLRQLVQKQPHMKARLVHILQRPDLTQTQKMEMAAALFNDRDNVHNPSSGQSDEAVIPS